MAAAKFDGLREPMRFSGVSVHVLGESGQGQSAPILEDIDLTLHGGEWLFMAGVNGSGKSTLARLLAGLHVEGSSGFADRGFAGNGASPVVLQRPEAQLFGETPREEVQFALEWREVPAEEIECRIERILAETGLTALADTRWEGLSGGQKQLAAVAAATAGGAAALVVFDEATAMLDDANRRAVLAIARKLQAEGTAIVWVTQRLDELGPDDRVVAMADGRIRFDGDGRTFFYGAEETDGHEVVSPCEACGLRLPYLAALAKEMKAKGRLSDPLPVTEQEWQEVLGDA